MNQDIQPHKTFPFKLAPWLRTYYASYLHWISYLLQRLGSAEALCVWQEVFDRDDDSLLLDILKTEWGEIPQGEWIHVEEAIAGVLSGAFPGSIEGVSPADAMKLVEMAPPIMQIKRIFASVNVWREMTALEALHLRFDGVALLAEALIRRYGKQGELIVYDLLREERLKAGAGKTGSVAEFLTDFIAAPKEPNLFTAGIESQVLQVTENEVVLHIKDCAWARYFRQHHPSVGYLMACSTDEVAYRAFNENLRMQRTSTLMEGGEVCDFRIYMPE